MAGKKGAARGRGKGKGKGKGKDSAVPDVYQDMLIEALPAQSEIPERPLKRRRIERRDRTVAEVAQTSSAKIPDQDEDDEELQFEDVLEPPQGSGSEADIPTKRQQTAYRDSDEDSEESDDEWQGFNLDAKPEDDEPNGDLELTITKRPAAKSTASRRRPVTKIDKIDRLLKHKMHVLCLLSHVDRRNEWCNDSEVQNSLEALLDKKMLTFLRPKSDLSQFGRADSLKRGLDQVAIMWRTKYSITKRGLRRALWADDEKDIQNFQPDDTDLFDKSGFREAAKTLKGSRDLGAQLFCALLRSAGVKTRLICSLQPLSFNAGGPAMLHHPAPKKALPEGQSIEGRSNTHDLGSSFSISSTPAAGLYSSPRSRLGHPNAAAYNIPKMNAPPRPPPRPKPRPIVESDYPVFWVEVFDEAHQKWFPVDPLVTETISKPRAFEPPASDRENNMSYVIAFEEEHCARDVTRRYAKAYNAKTRKNRVESTQKGDKWWRRTMRAFKRGWMSDADQIEDIELAATEAKEPMPKNIADFKDHPYYALERHLKRNEILISTRECGKVPAGRDLTVPGGKKLESIYRRRDVKVAKSSDAWYRLGREVKMGEQPMKTVPAKRRHDDADDMGDDIDERAGTNLYTEDQTEVYEPPPIVNGRVPKNSYGNLDVFVPSMVPKGGCHVTDAETARAARLLNIDYSDALIGFEFRGRHGTAVLRGAVIATEYREAVEAVIAGFRDDRAQAEEIMRTNAALKMWKRMLFGLRIKERIDSYAGDDEQVVSDAPDMDCGEDDGPESDEYVDDDGGGGFFPE
ncbi:hypothetical protein QTJ16_002430 [Diplocarpon rosae]|uniref:DNA repair protein rhp41 n=1 Tax=Diplocarpon rosae TaxID=946125 RepID=A0AAD9WG71_9HELO|nr:hypothetical protein QTJ16_002430 [Diplocarpon rosae]